MPILHSAFRSRLLFYWPLTLRKLTGPGIVIGMLWPYGQRIRLAIVGLPVQTLPHKNPTRTLPQRVKGGALVVQPGMPFPI